MIADEIRKKNKSKQIINWIIFGVMICISIAVVIFAGKNFFGTIYESKNEGKEYEKLNKKIFIEEPDEITNNVSYETLDNNSDSNGDNNSFVDWKTLIAENDTTKGILYIPGTQIKLPFVQGVDNQFYLHHSIDNSYSNAGTLFMDCSLNQGVFSDNIIIYGHNMRNGTMFGSLGKYLDESYAKKHNEIYVFTESNTKTYEVFAVYTTINGSNTYTTRFSNTENFIKYKNNMSAQSNIDFGVDTDNNKRVLTLSTCYSGGDSNLIRTIVQAQEK